ncbi:MAG: alpha/beta hydrolase [Verrucomicrobiota bacterium]
MFRFTRPSRLLALAAAATMVSLTTALHAASPAAALAPLPAKQAATYAKDTALPGVNADTFASIVVARGIEYARYGDRALVLDLYLPAERTKAVPCVMVIAGGGFLAQDTKRFAATAAYLASRGFAAACIAYRGTPDDTFIATIHDTKAAVRWVRANAAAYNIAPARIGAIGQSAGAHLVTMLAVSGDVAEFEGKGGNPTQSSRIQAGVSLAGVFDFISRLKDGGHEKHALAEKRKTNGAWVGVPFSETSEEWKRASTTSYVTKDDAPVLFVHCHGDVVAPLPQSEQMYAALKPFAPHSKLILYDGGGHGILRAKGINVKMWEEAIAFFQAELK